MTNIDWIDFASKNQEPVLKCIGEVIKRITLPIDIKKIPEIIKVDIKLTPAEFQKLEPEEIYIRWINYHLGRKKLFKRIHNLGKDMAYLQVLETILKVQGIALVNKSKDKATNLVEATKNVRIPDLIKPHAITSGTETLIAIFVSFLFKYKHCIEKFSEKEVKAIKIEEEDNSL